jgi:hypothetical protein
VEKYGVEKTIIDRLGAKLQTSKSKRKLKMAEK